MRISTGLFATCALALAAARCAASTTLIFASNATGTATLDAYVASPCGAETSVAPLSSRIADSNIDATALFSSRQFSDGSQLMNQVVERPLHSTEDSNASSSRSYGDDAEVALTLPVAIPDAFDATSSLAIREARAVGSAISTRTPAIDRIVVQDPVLKSHGSFLAAAASLNKWTIGSLIGFAVLNLSFVLFM